ncbi:MAG: ester cyclase [Candidatus Riflebacteria bacterium]|nr:ester cyclase [Candidatus Riflebacteria bacterium]
MPECNELETISKQWISLWCPPVDWKLFDQLHSDHFEDCSSGGRPPTKEGFAQGLKEFVTAFPDLHTTIEDLVIDEKKSQVAVRWSAHGTNRLPFLGNGPTNRITQISGIEIIEISNGKIVRRWGEWDISAHFEK